MIDKINQVANINNPKKRVLFIITKSELGGSQRFLYEFTTRLNPQKYDIGVAAGPEGNWDLLNRLNKKGIKTFKLEYLRREVSPLYDIPAVFELINLINKFKPEYLHLNSSKTGVLGSIANQILKIIKLKQYKKMKLIYRIGGWAFNDPSFGWKRKVWLAAEKVTAGFKDIIITESGPDEIQAKKLGIKPKIEVKTIHNGIDALRMEFLEKETAKLYLFKNIGKRHGKIFQKRYSIGTIANFYPTKGLEYLIEAMRILKNTDFNLIIIGDGLERKKLESKIAEYELKNDIILAGQIQDAYKYLKAFDIFILSSIKEGFPWVILEAMAAKLPIIATRVGALEEMLENGKSGILVESKNPRQMAEAIKYLLENETVRQEIAIQTHQTVLFKFTMEKMVRETEELFN